MKDGITVTPPPSVAIVIHTESMAVFQLDYTINSVTASDVGPYSCTVTNPIGSDSETITVILGKSQFVLVILCYCYHKLHNPIKL